MKKIILSIFLAIIFLFAISSSVFAITETSGDLQVSWDDPLFPSSIVWYPGLTVPKSFTVRNIGGVTHQTSLETANTSQTKDFANNLFFRVDSGATNYFGGSDDKTMKNFWDNGQTNLSDILSENSSNYTVTVTMPAALGNEFQGATAKFDLIVGFVGTESKVTISGDGGGNVAGATAPVCNDQKPGSAPVLLSAIAGINSVTLTWAKATDPVSYYLMTFGTVPGAQTYGNPNVGDKNTTSYTVYGLSGGATYYFKVRAGNGCMPGDFSNELSSAPTGVFIAGVPAGFEAGILGEATGEAPLKAEVVNVGNIKGEATGEQCKKCNFLFSLIIESLLIIFYFRYLISKLNNKKIYSILIPMITYIIFYFQNKNCINNFIFINSPNILCRHFPLVVLLIYGLSLFIFNLMNKKRSS